MSLPACDVPANAVHPVSHLLRAHRLHATTQGRGVPETGTRVTDLRFATEIPASSLSQCQIPSHARIEVFPVSFGSDIRKRTGRKMIRMSEPGHQELIIHGRKCPPWPTPY